MDFRAASQRARGKKPGGSTRQLTAVPGSLQKLLRLSRRSQRGQSGDHDLLRVNDGDAMDGAIGGPGFDTCVVDASIEAADTCETVIYR